MKIRLNELRRLIREEIESEEDLRADAFASTLFPWRGKNNTVEALADKFRSLLPIRTNVPHLFVKTYYDELMKITDGGEVEYLGGGAVGDAYEFTSGDRKGMVLKIEPSWASIGSQSPQGKWQDRIWGKEGTAKTHPMVYDRGEIPLSKGDMALPGHSIKWSVIERLETIPRGLQHAMNDVISYCESHRDVASAWRGVDHISLTNTSILNIPERLGLSTETITVHDGKGDVEVPVWFRDIFDAVKLALGDRDVRSDTHAGNLGFRRMGGRNVEWVFFD